MMTLFWCYLAIGAVFSLAAIKYGPPEEYKDASNAEIITVAIILLFLWLPAAIHAAWS